MIAIIWLKLTHYSNGISASLVPTGYQHAALLPHADFNAARECRRRRQRQGSEAPKYFGEESAIWLSLRCFFDAVQRRSCFIAPLTSAPDKLASRQNDYFAADISRYFFGGISLVSFY